MHTTSITCPAFALPYMVASCLCPSSLSMLYCHRYLPSLAGCACCAFLSSPGFECGFAGLGCCCCSVRPCCCCQTGHAAVGAPAQEASAAAAAQTPAQEASAAASGAVHAVPAVLWAVHAVLEPAPAVHAVPAVLEVVRAVLEDVHDPGTALDVISHLV